MNNSPVATKNDSNKVIIIVLLIVAMLLFCCCSGGVLFYILSSEDSNIVNENDIEEDNDINNKNSNNSEIEEEEEEENKTDEDLVYTDDYSIPVSQKFVQEVNQQDKTIGNKIGIKNGKFVYGPIGGNPDVFNYAMYLPYEFEMDNTNDFGATFYSDNSTWTEVGIIMFPKGEPEADDFTSCEEIVYALFPDSLDYIDILSTKNVYVNGYRFDRVEYTLEEEDGSVSYGIDQCSLINGNVYDAFLLLGEEDRVLYEGYAEAILDNLLFEKIELN